MEFLYKLKNVRTNENKGNLLYKLNFIFCGQTKMAKMKIKGIYYEFLYKFKNVRTNENEGNF